MTSSKAEKIIAGYPSNAETPRSVLYICGMNAIRSPMAAGITKTLFPHIIYTRSAGVHKGERDRFVDTVLEEVDVNISTHNPHTFEELNDGDFELTIALTHEAYNHALSVWQTPQASLEYWPIDDPSLEGGSRGQRLFAYRKTRDLLTQKIKDRLSWTPKGI